MKKLVCFILSSILIISVSIAPAQQNDDNKAVDAFENRVTLFEKFFAARPIILMKETHKKVPTGYIYFWRRYESCQISYDIKKTNSLVSPIMGDITLICDLSQTEDCNDSDTYILSVEEARKYKDNNSCYKKHYSNVGYKFIFALQKEQWVFKDVLNLENNNTDKLLITISGKSIGSWFPDEENNFWRILIQR